MLDHPIFLESISLIKARLGPTGLDPLQQNVLVRLIHSSGDFGIQPLLHFSPNACLIGLSALKAGAPIITDTAMASAAIKPMAKRTLNSSIRNVLEWVPDESSVDLTRTAIGMKRAWNEISVEYVEQRAPIVLIGSAPKALDVLLDLVLNGASAPSLIIGMPVGFVGVEESKKKLSLSGLPHIRLNGTRGGAGLAAATINALMRASID